MTCKHDRLAFSTFTKRVICLECGQGAAFMPAADKYTPFTLDAAKWDKMAAAVKEDTRNGWHTFDDEPPRIEYYYAMSKMMSGKAIVRRVSANEPMEGATHWHRDTLGLPTVGA